MSENVVTLKDYQQWTNETAIYPDAGTGNLQEIMYCALGLSSEAGEMSNYVKKLYRDGDTPEMRQNVADELGDVLWYAARTAESLGVNLQELMEKNQAKLVSRKERGKLTGSGDHR